MLGVLAVGLGALAAGDVARRENAVAKRLGPLVNVVVARDAVPKGERLAAGRLAVRTLPGRYAPAGAFAHPADLAGLRAAVAIAAGSDVVAGMVDDGSASAPRGAPVRAGERVADLVAMGSPQLIVPGSRVDVLVTRGNDGQSGRTELALEDVEVLTSSAAAAAPGDDPGPHVAVSLRVTLRQAVFLAAAQSFAREIRLLPRAPGDRRRGAEGMTVGSGLTD